MSDWRRVVSAALDAAGIDDLADRVVATLVAESPVMSAYGDLQEFARRSTAANLGLVADMLRGTVDLATTDPPPQASAYARELARRNVPMTELARAYRVAQHEMWRFGVAALRERITEPATEIEAYTDATFSTGEVLIGSALDRYGVERDRWVRSVDAVRRATVQELLAGGSVDTDAASARLHYELRRPHVAFVVWSEAGEQLESIAMTVGGAGALVVPVADDVMAGWCAPEALGRDPAGAALAVGLPGEGVAGFRTSHQQALEARRVARLAGTTGVVDYSEIALTALLTADLEQARLFVARELGALAEPDAARLAETALELLAQQGSPRRAAHQLGVHENTVAKRIRAAEEVLGRRIDARPAQTFAALLILRAVR
jgi:DNA-binding PucR family transcriptional regulator